MTDPASFLPLTNTAFEILLALAKEDLHGYAIIQSVEKRTRGGLELHPGTLYRALARLLDLGLVDELDERPDPDLDDERRRYYYLSELGRLVVLAEAERLAGQVRAVRKLKFRESAR